MSQPGVLTSSSAFAPAVTCRSTREEALLIQQVLARQQDQFEDLVKPHMNFLAGLVRKRIRNDSEADDIIQETLLKAFTHLAQFRFESSFRTWLIQIAINEIRQRYRRKVPEVSIRDQFKLVDGSLSPLEEMEQQEAIERFHKALSRLPKTYRSVVRLRDMQEYSISEVAKLLHLSVAAVKTRYHRGRLLMMRFR